MKILTFHRRTSTFPWEGLYFQGEEPFLNGCVLSVFCHTFLYGKTLPLFLSDIFMLSETKCRIFPDIVLWTWFFAKLKCLSLWKLCELVFINPSFSFPKSGHWMSYEAVFTIRKCARIVWYGKISLCERWREKNIQMYLYTWPDNSPNYVLATWTKYNFSSYAVTR